MKRTLLLFSFLSSIYSFAQDECTSATTLTPSTVCQTTSGTLQTATTSTITVGCDGYFDVFYKFVATSATVDIIATPATGSALDLKLSIFSSCGGTAIDCKDGAIEGEAESLRPNALAIGNTYYIKVAEYNSVRPTNSNFTICVVNAVRPTNDECTNALLLTQSSSCNTTSGSLSAASKSTGGFACGGNEDVYYKFIATHTSADIKVTSGSGLNLAVAFFASCGTTPLMCSNNTSIGVTQIMKIGDLSVGSTYYIKVAYLSSTSASKDFTICVQSLSRPANDDCADAIALNQTTTCVNTLGTVLNASSSPLNPTSCSTAANPDVFYKFVAVSASAEITVTPSSDMIPAISAYSSCGGSSIGCVISNTRGAQETILLNNLTIGNTYYLKVEVFSYWNSSTFTFNICVQNTTSTATTAASTLTAIQLYPNPTQNLLNVSNIKTSTKIELVDLAGKTLLNETISDDALLNLANYPAGVYVLKLTIDGITENRRIVLSN